MSIDKFIFFIIVNMIWFICLCLMNMDISFNFKDSNMYFIRLIHMRCLILACLSFNILFLSFENALLMNLFYILPVLFNVISVRGLEKKVR